MFAFEFCSTFGFRYIEGDVIKLDEPVKDDWMALLISMPISWSNSYEKQEIFLPWHESFRTYYKASKFNLKYGLETLNAWIWGCNMQ